MSKTKKNQIYYFKFFNSRDALPPSSKYYLRHQVLNLHSSTNTQARHGRRDACDVNFSKPVPSLSAATSAAAPFPMDRLVEQFRACHQARGNKNRKHASAPVVAPEAARVELPGFSTTHYFCTMCTTMRPRDAFCPSDLKRSVFYCKACALARRKASRQLRLSKRQAEATDSGARPPVDPAIQMLDRLRRMTAHPPAFGFAATLTWRRLGFS